MLHSLAEDEHLNPLRSFRRHALYANVFNDIIVPFSTASIAPLNLYRGKMARDGDGSVAESAKTAAGATTKDDD